MWKIPANVANLSLDSFNFLFMFFPLLLYRVLSGHFKQLDCLNLSLYFGQFGHPFRLDQSDSQLLREGNMKCVSSLNKSRRIDRVSKWPRGKHSFFHLSLSLSLQPQNKTIHFHFWKTTENNWVRRLLFVLQLNCNQIFKIQKVFWCKGDMLCCALLLLFKDRKLWAEVFERDCSRLYRWKVSANLQHL